MARISKKRCESLKPLAILLVGKTEAGKEPKRSAELG
jgi:hypothetical protein